MKGLRRLDEVPRNFKGKRFTLQPPSGFRADLSMQLPVKTRKLARNLHGSRTSQLLGQEGICAGAHFVSPILQQQHTQLFSWYRTVTLAWRINIFREAAPYLWRSFYALRNGFAPSFIKMP